MQIWKAWFTTDDYDYKNHGELDEMEIGLYSTKAKAVAAINETIAEINKDNEADEQPLIPLMTEDQDEHSDGQDYTTWYVTAANIN